ncbi:MAG: hypothetical protein ACRCZI_06490, partial [Cetobacterium sp.]
VIKKPIHSIITIQRHEDEEARRKARQTRLRDALIYEASKLEERADAKLAAKEDDSEERYKIVQKLNDIEILQYEIDDDLQVTLKGKAKTEWDTEWKIYKTRIESIEKHRGQAFNMIKGQCTLALMEQMKCDSDYTRCIASNDPLRLKSLIERTIITQSDNKYVFATLYEQEVGLFGFQQNKLTEDQWHERFNTKVSIGDTLGVSRDHTMALNYVAKERFNKEFDDLIDDDERESVRSDAQERYLAYIFLRQSGPQHEKLKTDLGDAFTVAGDSMTRARIYPKTRDEVYGQLQRYHKVKKTTVTSEGSSFVQAGRGRGSGRAGRTSGRFDKEYWADKKCHKCDKLGHPASACKKKDTDDKSTGSN